MKSIAGILLFVSVCAPALAQQRSLTFEERVRAQEAIERVYYGHQIGATKPFEQAVPREVLERKVRTYLEESVALQVYWKTPVTDLMLERELERMARGTRMPERLIELYAALGDDPFLVKECLARATLVDRLARNFFAFDPVLHAKERREAERLRQRLSSGDLKPSAEYPRRTVIVADLKPKNGSSKLSGSAGQVSPLFDERGAFTLTVGLNEVSGGGRLASYLVPKSTWDSWWGGVRRSLPAESVPTVASPNSARVVLARPPGSVAWPTFCPEDDTWDNGVLDDVPLGRLDHTAVWTGNVMIVWGGRTDSGYFNSGGRYDPATDSWAATSLDDAPSVRTAHTAVWTGMEMVIWGGESPNPGGLNTGGRHDPVSDHWSATSTENAPSARSHHTAVWTGRRMLVWGGFSNSGGSYDPGTDTWQPISTVGAPSPRYNHSAVWTGTEMLVWGGTSGNESLNSGGRYSPESDSWLPISLTDAPDERGRHTAIWVGDAMLVWGGLSFNYGSRNDGGRYDPVTDSWTSISTAGAPSGRWSHSAVWTGQSLIVWGGRGGFPEEPLQDGGRYDPTSDSWTSVAVPAFLPARYEHTAIWTGSLMVVWGGSQGSNDGGRYDPNSDSWTPTLRAPTGASQHTAVWTGNVMIEWGAFGFDHGEGGRYDPITDEWSPTTTVGAPFGRRNHTAVWTGQEMIIWGGSDYRTDDGGRYDPISDSWSSTSRVGAPVGRTYHTAVWTGTRMVIWGGAATHDADVNTGGRYDPLTDTWEPTSTVNAPLRRYKHTSIWTGNRMIVWGGATSVSVGVLNSGGSYDPINDRWTVTSAAGAPPPRYEHIATWTGTHMLVWGGTGGEHSGGRYDPDSNSWTPIATTGSYSARFATGVWTGRSWLIWGGLGSNPLYSNAGAQYDPALDAWSPVSSVGAPSGRYWHTAVWTGRFMIVWGGQGSTSPLSDGGRYVAASVESCNGIDDDCDGIVDNGNAVCDDNNTCTDDTCGGEQGCLHVPRSGACDDGNDCTSEDACDGARCTGVSVEGLQCDDGNACTLSDSCHSGHCNGAPRTCTDNNACNGLETCDTASGCMPGSPLHCDDGSICTGIETCDPASGCVAGTPLHCNDGNVCNGFEGCNYYYGCTPGQPLYCNDANPCTIDSCDPIAGCQFPTSPDGTPCTGGNACLSEGRCASGVCQPGQPVNCNDANVCTEDYCDVATGCQHPLTPAAQECDDGFPCTLNSCDPITGECEFPPAPAGELCNDFFPCTGPDQCDGSGNCLGAPMICDDGNQCTDDTCDSVTGECVNVPRSGGSCDDGNPCTLDDTCNGTGTCVAGSGALDCRDANPCTDDSCNPVTGCVYSNNTAACDDGSACTSGDVCGGGACNGTPVACNDCNGCTDDTCNPATGCVYANNTNGCDDGSACTSRDVCSFGTCSGTAMICNDGNTCTDDTCSPSTGCVYLNNTTACSDGNGCTIGDACGGGSCHAGAPVFCAASDQCHAAGVCDTGTGLCSNPAVPDGTSCDDGNAGTSGDSCQGGVCTGSSCTSTNDPKTKGWYKGLCHGPHSGDALTAADAACVASKTVTFAGISTVADICEVLEPSHPNNDTCSKSNDELMTLALNLCRQRVCGSQAIDSTCGNNSTVSQSLAESDAILASASRTDATCDHASCLDKEINRGIALEMNTVSIRRESGGVRLTWLPVLIDDGAGQPARYRISRRASGSLAPFATIGSPSGLTFLDAGAASGSSEYQVTALSD